MMKTFDKWWNFQVIKTPDSHPMENIPLQIATIKENNNKEKSFLILIPISRLWS